MGPRGQLKDGLFTMTLNSLAYLILSDTHIGVAKISVCEDTKHLFFFFLLHVAATYCHHVETQVYLT